MEKSLFLPPSFYQRSTDVVARELLGKLLVRQINGKLIKARIVETEAYFGQDDPASHACRGKTKRNAVMFGAPGCAYVYFNYGMHYLLNVVTEPEGKAGAVLIRAVEPVAGLPKIVNLTNGPAKLTKALGIDLTFNGKALNSPTLGIIDGDDRQNYKIVASPRIGISQGQELFLRFYIAANPFVSKTKPLKEEVDEVKRGV
jgi:DNA-3-methyladenine glycosylase